LEDIDEVVAFVTNRVPESEDVVAIAMPLTPDDVGQDVPGTDDVWVKTREVEFVDVLVDTNLGCENETAPVGVVERSHRVEELVASRTPQNKDAAVVSFADLDSCENVADGRPRVFLDRLLRA